MRELFFSSNEKILIIAPHPDDECIGPGGILIKYGTQCDIIVLTDGRQGQGDILPEEEKKIRKQEFMEEMHLLNINSYNMLEIEDGTLVTHLDCLNGLDLNNYNKIFVTGINDEHIDHKAAFLCVEEWIKNNKSDFIPAVYTYEVHTPLSCPTHFLDVTDCLDKKIALVNCHKSQNKELPYNLLVEQSAMYRAILHRMPLKKIEVYEEIDIKNYEKNAISNNEIELQKEKLLRWSLNRWVERLVDGDLISNWFNKNGIKRVYVFGYGVLGKLLIKELAVEGIEIAAIIDRRAEQFRNTKINIIKLNEITESVPIIVTAIFEYSTIEKTIKSYGKNKVYSLRRILEENGD